MKLGIWASTIVVLGVLGTAVAAMTLEPLHWVTDTRRCSASFSGNGTGSTWQDRTVAFDPFQGAADLLATNGVETWSAHSTEQSEMDTHSVSYTGTATAVIIAGVASLQQHAQSQALLDVWFTIDVAVDYRLHGEVNESGDAESAALVRLTALNGDVLEEIISARESSRTFERAGTLQPGTYRLYAAATGACRTFPATVYAQGDASCEMEFTVDGAMHAPLPRPTESSATGAPARP